MSDVDVARLVRDAGFPPDQPLSFAARGRGGEVSGSLGIWPTGEPVVAGDLFYGASLTKQVTGAVAAQLAASGAFDVDRPIDRHYLPRWTQLPTPRHLLHHVGSLSEDAALRGADATIRAATSGQGTIERRSWTNAHALEIAAELPPPDLPPGSAHIYSNLGYILLARTMEQQTGRSFAELAARVLPRSSPRAFAIRDEKVQLQSPQLAGLGPCLPLSTGDGGLWTTAAGYLDFLEAQNRDDLGIAHLTQSDYLLTSGEPATYGWGIGIRRFRDYPLYIHGGGWMGSRSKAVRCPALDLAVVVLATADADAVGKLVDVLCEAVAE